MNMQTYEVPIPQLQQLDHMLDEIAHQEESKRNNENSINWKVVVREIHNNNINYVEKLLKSEQINANQKNPLDGKTLLIYAVTNGDFDLVALICNFSADIMLKDNDDLDALDYAIKYSRYKIIKYLYYKLLTKTFGADLNIISTLIQKRNKEAQSIYDSHKKLSEEMTAFMQYAIKQQTTFDDTMLYYAWYFTTKEFGENIFSSPLWKDMMTVYEETLSATFDKARWKWLKEQFITSLIWFSPHPNKSATDEAMEQEKKDNIEYILQNTLFSELLSRLSTESEPQSDNVPKETVVIDEDSNLSLIPYEKCIFLNHYRNVAVKNDERWILSKQWIDSKRSRWIDIVALEAYVSAADGVLSDLEKKAMTDHKILFGVDPTQIEEGFKKADKMIHSNDAGVIDTFVDNEWNDLKNNPHVPMTINLIASCIYFAAVDGLDPKELEAAHEIALKFGLGQEIFDKLTKALENEEKLFHQFNELFALPSKPN